MDAGRRTRAREWYLRERVVAGLAGFAAGSLAVFAVTRSVLLAWLVLFVCGAVISARLARVSGLAGIGAGTVVWLITMIGRLAPPTPTLPTGFGVSLRGAELPIAAIAVGWWIAWGGWVIGQSSRPGMPAPRRPRAVHATSVLVGVVAIVAAGWSFVAITPAGSSFSVDVPSGWRHVSIGWDDTPPEECRDLAVVQGSDDVDLVFPTAPLLCAAVFEFPPDRFYYSDGQWQPTNWSEPQSCVRALDLDWGHDHRVDHWALVGVPPSPISGGYEEVRSLSSGERAYRVGTARWRSVATIAEHVCYVLTVQVPSGSSFRAEDATSIFSTFAFR